MKQLGKKFTKAQWDYCCENEEFVKLYLTDLVAAERLAVQLLSSAELAALQADYEEEDETE